jgi:hypothetical protein
MRGKPLAPRFTVKQGIVGILPARVPTSPPSRPSRLVEVALHAANLAKSQLWFLAAVSGLLLWMAPEVWNFTPDGGIYVGTANALAEGEGYRFNGHPNLLYYPGLSSLLSMTILAFGIDFHVMHLMCAGIALACLWLARAYFSHDRYGIAGLAVPVLMVSAGIFLRQVFNILSDGLFLALVLGAALLWRRYAETSSGRALIGCCVLVAAAPLVRFEGLLLCVALGAALLHKGLRDRRLDPRFLARLAAIFIAIVATFALWTWRNWVLYTPDTFNVANSFFFGLGGMRLYAPDLAAGQSDAPVWHYAAFRVVLFVTALGKTILGDSTIATLPRGVWFVAIIGLAAAGAARWFARATSLERVFVLLSLVFLLLWTLKGGRSLYIVPRYWLPVLPFVLVLVGLGVAALHDRVRGTPVRYAVAATAVALVALATVNGAGHIVGHSVRSAYYRSADDVIRRTAAYVAEQVPAETRIAATDWGVLPFSLERRSVQTLNDESHQLTLARMSRYQTRYLVILDGLAVFPRFARRMIARFPDMFSLVFEARPAGRGPVASVYVVDLEKIDSALGQTSRAP